MYTATDPTLMGTGSCVSNKVNPFTYIVIISAPGKFYCRNKCIYGLLEISVIFNVLMQEPCIGKPKVFRNGSFFKDIKIIDRTKAKLKKKVFYDLSNVMLAFCCLD